MARRGEAWRGVARRGLAWRGGRVGDPALLFEALAQRRERDVGEGGYAEIGMGEIVVGGRGAGGGDAPEVGTFGGETAGVRVFEGDGFVAAEAEVFEDQFVEVGLRFRCAHVFAAGDVGKAVEQAQARKVGLNPGVFGVGGDRDGQVGGARLIEEGDHAGERSEEFEAAFFGVLALGFESDAVVVGGEISPRVEREIGVADAAEEASIVEPHAVGGVNIGVGPD